MKVIIAGGRNFNNYALLKQKVNYYLSFFFEGVEIVSGKALGADTLGERYAKEYNWPVKEFPADWGGNGKAAGPMRNKQMAEYADALIAFWDGKSKGTADMIKQAKERGLEVRIVKY